MGIDRPSLSLDDHIAIDIDIDIRHVTYRI